MKKSLVVLVIVMMGTMVPVQKAGANNPIAVLEIIKAAVIKVIKAVDLKVQRLQNKTIWLQNAQKTLENELSKLKLDNISDWAEKQKSLYKDYHDELLKVKAIIAECERIKDISEKQVRIVEQYQWAWALLNQDKNFTDDELNYMELVYSGILDQSIKNIDQLSLVVNSFATQMTDGQRMEIINETADQVNMNYYDLLEFNQQNILLSLQRAKTQNDVNKVKKTYGIE